MNDINLKEFEDQNGEKHIIAMECNISDRKFIITNGRKIFEIVDGHYKECTQDDEETVFLKKYTAPARAVDIEIDETR